MGRGMKLPSGTKAKRVEILAAVVLSAVIIGLHIANLLSAGPLWRDEISSLSLATRPSWTQVWATLVYDPFPAFFFTLLRVWHSFFGDADFALRTLGFLIGLLGLSGFWISACLTGRRSPLLALILIAFSPTLIVWGDSLRAYGVAVFWILIAFACFWRVINDPRPREIVAATLVAVLSAQSIFTNAPLIFACGMAAAMVAARRRHWKRALLVLAIGAVAALSLLPYQDIIRATQDWAAIRKFPLGMSAHLEVMREALLNGGEWFLWLWVLLAVVAVAWGCALQFDFAFHRPLRELRDPVLYSLLAGVLGLVVTLLFLTKLSWPTHIWYYLPLLAMLATALDLALDLGQRVRSGPLLRMLIALVFVSVSFSVVAARVQTRASNLDIVASFLEKSAGPDDLIVIFPFVDGITFQRYYQGSTRWTTLPRIADLSLHRWDQLMERVRQPNDLGPFLDEVNETLRGGHQVWIASTIPMQPTGQPSRRLQPYTELNPHLLGYYLGGWRDLFLEDLANHAEKMAGASCSSGLPISPYEHSSVLVFSGWREQPEVKP